MNGGFFLLPYGEWILFGSSLIAWAEKSGLRRFFFWLDIAWIGGKIVEGLMGYTPLHWNIARLAVLLVFCLGAWHRSHQSLFSLVVPSVILVAEDLLIANEPGIIPLENWLFLGALFLTAWLSTRSYWGMAAVVAGSLMIKEGFSIFTDGGLFRHQDLPNSFYWHASALVLLVMGLIKELFELKKEYMNTQLLYNDMDDNG